MIDQAFSLKGRVAAVTGASSGIGRHLAITFARAGADVVLIARKRERLQSAASEIEAFGGRAAVLAADLGTAEGVDAAAAGAALPFGAPNIVLNAAGINLREPVDQVTWDTWGQTLHINLTVPFFFSRALVPGMIAAGYGRIINIASLQSYRAFANSMPYGASKGGIVQLTRAMAEAWSAKGVTANAIAPGFFPTELTAAVYADSDKVAHNAKMTAIGRNGELADLEGAAVFLAAPASAYITGQTLSVDGGFTAK